MNSGAETDPASFRSTRSTRPSRAQLAAGLAAAPIRAVPSAHPAAAEPAPPADAAPPAPPPRKGARPHGEIWEGCPVKALGVNGELSYYLDRHGQMRAVSKHEAQKILHLFGDRLELLCSHFPQFDKDGARKSHRFDQTTASMALITAASEKGLFNPDGAVRGVGAWTDDLGRLIYHTGLQLLTADGPRPPSEIDGRIYPAYPPIPAPADKAPATVAEDILGTLNSWAWQQADTAPLLALGMIGVQMLAGALDWRPAFWVTGDKASGKSELQRLLGYLHGQGGLIQSTDATKSGVTSRIGHSALPVAIDELEPGEEGQAREREIIVLARIAASGGQWVRGTADQKGASGNVYSAFLFSSILIPGAMGPQDRSRIVTLGLGPLDKDAPKLVLDPRTWRGRGAALKRLLIDRWPSWAERLAAWRTELADQGLGGRNGDNYATTLAMADMALSEALPDAERLETWARKTAFAARAEIDEIGSDAEDMLMHLIGQPLDVYRRGELFTVAQWLMVAGELPAAPGKLRGELNGGEGSDDRGRALAAQGANAILAKYGLRVQRERDRQGQMGPPHLFIANAPIPGLARLFQDSRWQRGVWAQSARRVPGATRPAEAQRLAGQRSRGTLIPFAAIAGLMSFPMDRAQSAAAPDPYSDLNDFAP